MDPSCGPVQARDAGMKTSVVYVSHQGTEESIIEAARMSTGKGFQGWDKDERLLEYLYRHEHMSPFEMCSLIVDVECPIFVARQWMRHRTFSYNELSARYTRLPEKIYQPCAAEIRLQDPVNRQGSLNQELVTPAMEEAERIFREAAEASLAAYRRLLDLGVAREQARAVMPVGTYTRFRAAANLRNWLHFLRLRLDSHAQAEIREAARQAAAIVRSLWPRTWRLFEEHTLKGAL